MTPNERLQQLHDDFTDELASMLDIEAGLAEALQHSQHEGVARDLAGELDVETGLEDALRRLPTEESTYETVAPTSKYPPSDENVVAGDIGPPGVGSIESGDLGELLEWDITEITDLIKRFNDDSLDAHLAISECDRMLRILKGRLLERSISREDALEVIEEFRRFYKAATAPPMDETDLLKLRHKDHVDLVERKLNVLAYRIHWIFDTSDSGAQQDTPIR
jgi:hypothetical protein